MAKLTAPVRDAARLLDLVPYLDSHPYISIADLASEFKTTQDEMRTLLTTLTMCGTPGLTPYDLIEVNFDSDFVTINQHEDLNIVRTLTAEEALATLLGLTLMKEEITGENENLAQVIESLLNKLRKGYGNFVSAQDNPAARAAQVILDGIRARQQICITYGDSTLQRQIDPLNIIEVDGSLYCEAFCFTAQDFRTFALERIHTMTPASSSLHYEPRELPTKRKSSVTLRVHRRKRNYVERFSIGHLNRRNEGECQYFSDSWLVREVLAAAGEVEVVGDNRVRATIAAQATEILKLYQD